MRNYLPKKFTIAASFIIALLLLIAPTPALADDCHYLLPGDLNQDCKVDFLDFAVFAFNWLIDCNSDPQDPACIPLDLDDDGYNVTVDCNDHNPNINPGQYEICGNGIDDDCDSLIDFDDPDCYAYSHTIVIDGIMDFTPEETFTTTTAIGPGFYTWDSEYLYVGMQSPEVGTLDYILLLYIGGSPGTIVGLDWFFQQPILPFPAKYHIAWDTGGGIPIAFQYSGDTWLDAMWDFFADYAKMGDYMELRIPLADIGSPELIQVHLSMIDTLDPWTFAGVPYNSFIDGYDPDYNTFFQFDLLADIPPVYYVPLP